MRDKTPLELAVDLLAWKGPVMARHRVREIAAALVERMTPVDVAVGEMHTIACCKARVSGYPEDYPGRSLPKFCPNCGKPLVWK